MPWLVVVVDAALDGRLAAVLASARDAHVVVLTSSASTEALASRRRRGAPARGRDGRHRSTDPSCGGRRVGDLGRPFRSRFRGALRPRPRRPGTGRHRHDAAAVRAPPGSPAPRPARRLREPAHRNVVSGAGPAPGRARQGRRPPGNRPLPQQSPCAGGRHDRVRQVRAAAGADRRAGPEPPTGPLLVPARRLQGRRRLRRAARLPHTVGVHHRPRRPDHRPGPAFAGGRAAPAARHLLAAHRRRRPARSSPARRRRWPRLVIVVDEFATLAEELPALRAGTWWASRQRGRSLGIHLVLATQRPGGVVSPEIRANCTLRICLRTTDEADSRDVVGTPAAAHLPVRPARAARSCGPAGAPTARRPGRAGRLRRCRDPGRGPEAAGGPGRARRTRSAADRGDRGPAPSLRRHPDARTAGSAALPPIDRGAALPPAPEPGSRRAMLPAPDRAGGDPCCGWACCDLPDRQAQETLELDLPQAGPAGVGGARSGRSTVLRSVLHRRGRDRAPGDLHIHVIESGGGTLAADAAALPHTGPRSAARTRTGWSGCSTGCRRRSWRAGPPPIGPGRSSCCWSTGWTS